jgi:type II secretory pathway pseudopilin PulG
MKDFPSEHFGRRSNSKPTDSAFTFPELLVVINMIAVLALVLLPILLDVKESSMLVSCANNMKQIGVGCSVYASENSDILPTTGWQQSQNAFNTGLACRVLSIPSTQITTGPFSFGQLYFYAGVKNPQVFYCPTVQAGEYAYTSYTGPGYPWPAIPANYQFGPNAFVRCGYNYYPQSRILTQIVSLPTGNITLPACNFAETTFNPPSPPGGTPNSGTYATPLTLSQVNPQKAVAVDALTIWAGINHQYRGVPYGLNAAFPDGHVRFQTINQYDKRNSYQPFDQRDLWDPYIVGGPGDSSYSSAQPTFRIIMNGFQP